MFDRQIQKTLISDPGYFVRTHFDVRSDFVQFALLRFPTSFVLKAACAEWM